MPARRSAGSSLPPLEARGEGAHRRCPHVARRRQLFRHEAAGEPLAHALARDPHLIGLAAARTSVGMASPPPTMESPRSSLRPGISARFFSLARGHELDHVLETLPRQHVPVQRASPGSRASAGRPWPGCGCVPPVPTTALPGLQGRHPGLLEQARGRARSRRRTSPAVGGSDFKKASERRSEPRGRLTALVTRRCRKRVTCMLPPPTSKSTPWSTGRPPTAPRKPYRASSSPLRMRTSKSEALLDLRHEGLAVLGVAHGRRGQGEDARGPRAEGDGAEVLERLESAVLGLADRRWVASSSRTRRSEPRLLARIWVESPPSRRYTTMRAEFEPMSMTATGPSPSMHGPKSTRPETRKAPGTGLDPGAADGPEDVPTSCRSAPRRPAEIFRMSPKTCCWIVSFERFVPLSS